MKLITQEELDSARRDLARFDGPTWTYNAATDALKVCRQVLQMAEDEDLEELCDRVEARIAISCGDPVPQAGLVALSGLDHSWVWRLQQQGKAPVPSPHPDDRRRRVYEPAEARAWLESRGVVFRDEKVIE